MKNSARPLTMLFTAPFTLLMAIPVTSSAFTQERPEPRITDLVVRSAEWKQKIEPDYSAELVGENPQPAPFPRWLPGPQGTKLQFHVRLASATTFVAEIARANAPATARLLIDDREVSRLSITTNTFKGPSTPAKEGPLGSVNEDLYGSVPAGDHTITVYNVGTGWIEVPEVRIAGIGPKEFHIERKPVKTVQVREQVTMIAPNLRSKVWGIGVGTFPTDDSQTVHDLKITALDDEYRVDRVRDKTGQEFNLLYAASEPNHLQTITVQVDAKVTLYSRNLAPGPAPTPPTMTASDRERYTTFFDRNGLETVSAWMTQNKLIRGKGERDLEFAQRVLSVFRRTLRYKWAPDAPQGTAACLQRGWGACGDLNQLGVDVLKLAQIPARTRPGRNVVGETHTFSVSTDETMHVAAEMWATGIGWVPIEFSAMTGSSLTEGGPLRPFLGTADGTHLNKHYDSVYMDDTKRSFQLMDFPFGTWDGDWSGWHTESKYGFQTISSSAAPASTSLR